MKKHEKLVFLTTQLKLPLTINLIMHKSLDWMFLVLLVPNKLLVFRVLPHEQPTYITDHEMKIQVLYVNPATVKNDCRMKMKKLSWKEIEKHHHSNCLFSLFALLTSNEFLLAKFWLNFAHVDVCHVLILNVKSTVVSSTMRHATKCFSIFVDYLTVIGTAFMSKFFLLK